MLVSLQLMTFSFQVQGGLDCIATFLVIAHKHWPLALQTDLEFLCRRVSIRLCLDIYALYTTIYRAFLTVRETVEVHDLLMARRTELLYALIPHLRTVLRRLPVRHQVVLIHAHAAIHVLVFLSPVRDVAHRAVGDGLVAVSGLVSLNFIAFSRSEVLAEGALTRHIVVIDVV